MSQARIETLQKNINENIENMLKELYLTLSKPGFLVEEKLAIKKNLNAFILDVYYKNSKKMLPSFKELRNSLVSLGKDKTRLLLSELSLSSREYLDSLFALQENDNHYYDINKPINFSKNYSIFVYQIAFIFTVNYKTVLVKLTPEAFLEQGMFHSLELQTHLRGNVQGFNLHDAIHRATHANFLNLIFVANSQPECEIIADSFTRLSAQMDAEVTDETASLLLEGYLNNKNFNILLEGLECKQVFLNFINTNPETQMKVLAQLTEESFINRLESAESSTEITHLIIELLAVRGSQCRNKVEDNEDLIVLDNNNFKDQEVFRSHLKKAYRKRQNLIMNNLVKSTSPAAVILVLKEVDHAEAHFTFKHKENTYLNPIKKYGLEKLGELSYAYYKTQADYLINSNQAARLYLEFFQSSIAKMNYKKNSTNKEQEIKDFYAVAEVYGILSTSVMTELNAYLLTKIIKFTSQEFKQAISLSVNYATLTDIYASMRVGINNPIFINDLKEFTEENFERLTRFIQLSCLDSSNFQCLDQALFEKLEELTTQDYAQQINEAANLDDLILISMQLQHFANSSGFNAPSFEKIYKNSKDIVQHGFIASEEICAYLRLKIKEKQKVLNLVKISLSANSSTQFGSKGIEKKHTDNKAHFSQMHKK